MFFFFYEHKLFRTHKTSFKKSKLIKEPNERTWKLKLCWENMSRYAYVTIFLRWKTEKCRHASGSLRFRNLLIWSCIFDFFFKIEILRNLLVKKFYTQMYLWSNLPIFVQFPLVEFSRTFFKKICSKTMKNNLCVNFIFYSSIYRSEDLCDYWMYKSGEIFFYFIKQIYSFF